MVGAGGTLPFAIDLGQVPLVLILKRYRYPLGGQRRKNDIVAQLYRRLGHSRTVLLVFLSQFTDTPRYARG